MHPTLLIGPADWDAERLRQEEFAARMARLWELWPRAAGAIVYGDSRDHAALAYLTHFTPKLEPAIALIPRSGDPRLMVGGGANMIPAAKPLTWIADLVSLRPTGKTIAQWREGIGGPCVCIGIDGMQTRMRRELDRAFGGDTPSDRAAEWHQVMHRKSGRELACIREACALLQAAVTAMEEAKRGGKGVTGTVLAGEHAAVQGGAQDVRTLFSLDSGRTFRPFTTLIERMIDPLAVYVAMRRFGYWADAFVTLADAPNADTAQAQGALRDFLAAARPGTAIAEPIAGNSIGLALEERADHALEPGGVYSLRARVGGATASAMVAVSDTRVETLWPAA